MEAARVAAVRMVSGLRSLHSVRCGENSAAAAIGFAWWEERVQRCFSKSPRTQIIGF